MRHFSLNNRGRNCWVLYSRLFSKRKSVKRNYCLNGAFASAMLGFRLILCIHVHLSVNRTPVKWNILSRSFQVPFTESLLYSQISMWNYTLRFHNHQHLKLQKVTAASNICNNWKSATIVLFAENYQGKMQQKWSFSLNISSLKMVKCFRTSFHIQWQHDSPCLMPQNFLKRKGEREREARKKDWLLVSSRNEDLDK